MFFGCTQHHGILWEGRDNYPKTCSKLWIVLHPDPTILNGYPALDSVRNAANDSEMGLCELSLEIDQPESPQGRLQIHAQGQVFVTRIQ